jgi:hypothetical protein
MRSSAVAAEAGMGRNCPNLSRAKRASFFADCSWLAATTSKSASRAPSSGYLPTLAESEHAGRQPWTRAEVVSALLKARRGES